MPLVGNVFEFRKDPVGFLMKLAKDHGDIASFRLGPFPSFLVSRPEHIQEILVTQHRHVRRLSTVWVIKALFGDNMITLEGEEHRRRRKLMQPAFLHQKIQSYASIMADLSQRQQASWREGQTLDISREMHRLSMAIVTKTLLGFDLGSEEATQIKEAMDEGLDVMKDLVSLPLESVVKYLPLPISFRMTRSRKKMDAVITKVIEERRKSGVQTGDLLSLMMSLRDEEGTKEGLTDEELRDEALIFFAAGHETVATALTWLWYSMAQDPEVARKVHKEVSRVLGNRSPQASDLPSLEYTGMAFSETLRMYPPAWVTGKTVTHPFRIGSYEMPVGANIWLSPYITQHDPRIFPEPFKFIAERWTDEEKQKRHKYSFFPFGGGPRSCIGAGYARMEALLAIATIAQKWKLRLVPDQSYEVQPFMSYHLKNGLKVILERAS